MSYQALYRKYRPQVFEDVKGQEVIVRTLKNQIRSGRIGHAYLFCGSRGTGKTTAAKILARAINCENLQDGDPCGVCDSCRAILEGSSLNVIEMDAASRNGVDDFRQIIEEIEYPPTQGRYKVYIIDEVHMLSGAAFNAFLKTLEEPPSYAVFILATTDPQKLPATILSRCQRYDFRRIPSEIIEQRLREVLAEEGAQADDDAIRYIARKAEGGMRDALSLADQCLSFYIGQRLTYEHVLEVLGTVDREVYSRMLREAVNQNASGILKIFDELMMDGRDVRQIISDFAWYVRDLLLFRASGASSEITQIVSESEQELMEASADISEKSLMYYIDVLSELSTSLRNASNRRIQAEIGLIRLCRPQTAPKDLSALDSRIAHLEKLIESGKLTVISGANGAAASAAQISAGGALPGTEQSAAGRSGAGDGSQDIGEAREPVREEIAPELFRRIRSQWALTMNSLENRGWGAILAQFGSLWFEKDEENVLYIRLPSNWSSAFKGNKKAEDMVAEALEQKYQVRPQIRFIDEADSAAGLSKVNVVSELQKDIAFDIETEDE